MLLLPELQIETSSYWLPVSDQGADELEVTLLSPSSDSKVELLAATLSLEPGLAIWALSTFGRWESSPPSIFEIAEALSEDLGRLAIAEPLPFDSHDFESAEKWSERCVRAVKRARRAASEMNDPAYVHALLAKPKPWLRESKRPSNTTDRSSQAFPKWLHTSTRHVSPKEQRSGTKVRRKEIRERWRSGIDLHRTLELFPRIVDLNRRVEELESRFAETLEREKLDSLREFAYGASHEINNPLANIATRAQTLLRDEVDPERKRKLATISTQAFRAHEMIADMMLFAKPPDLQPQEADLAEILEAIVEEYRPQADAQSTRLELHLEEGIPTNLVIDPVQLSVAVGNLLRNSLEAIALGGDIRVTAAPAKNGLISIVVSDSGPGIPDALRKQIFDPYFSGREAGRGLGLGLSKCWRIVALHGGTIEVVNLPQGVSFVILLPQEPPTCPNTRTAG